MKCPTELILKESKKQKNVKTMQICKRTKRISPLLLYIEVIKRKKKELCQNKRA